MVKNASLHSAKTTKNDEFYTRIEDIECEMKHYKEFFKGKKVLCNCNDDQWSAFFKYFSVNYEHLGLAKLTCVSYSKEECGKKFVFEGDKNGNRKVDQEEIMITDLDGHGDFADEECIELLKECDVVVTNPPFSQFRKFIALMVEYDKKFLVIGNMNAITYKEVFPLIKENKLWCGIKSFSGGMDFIPGANYDASKCKHPKYNTKGDIIINVMGCVWFTNIGHDKRNTPLDLYKKYTPEEYPHYDNYDAINVNKVADIPMDYEGVIGVPITFLDKYCPTQFEIIGLDRYVEGNTMPNKRMHINGKEIYARILIKKVS